MTFSLLKAQALLKAAQHKYTHRKLIGRDPKTNRKRYRYYYAEHHGGGITSAEIEAGSAFKLTFKGRRGHFHVQSVEGDTVTVKHDGRPNSKPVEMTKAEFRALLKRQHETVENKKREKAQENRRRGRKKRKGSKRTKRKTTPQTQAPEQTPQGQEPEQGADNFETMPEPDPSPAREQLTETAREVVQSKPKRKPRKKKRTVRVTALAEKASKEISEDIGSVGKLHANTDSEGIIQSVDRGQSNAHYEAARAVKRALLNATDGLIDYYTIIGWEEDSLKNSIVQAVLDVYQPNKTEEQAQLELKRAIAERVIERLPRGIESLRDTPDYMKGAIRGKNRQIKERVKVLEAIVEDTNNALEELEKKEPVEVTAPEQTPQTQEPEQGADNLETMPEVESVPAREQLTETAREVETPPVKKKRARKPKKFGSSIPSKDELLEEFKGITESSQIVNEGNPILSQVFKVLNSPNTTKEQKNKFKRGLYLPLLNLNDPYEVESYLSERETRTGRGSDLFLPSALKAHGTSLDPFNVSEQAQEETGKVYNLYSSPSATNEESGLAFAFGTIKAEGVKPKQGLWAIHRDSGRLALVDDTVKPHQAPAILTFLGEELKDQLAKVNPDNPEHMKIFGRATRSVSLARQQRQSDLAEMLARILNDPRLNKSLIGLNLLDLYKALRC